MTDTIKPFRLINECEIKRLQQTIASNLSLWNEQYAMHALSLTLRAKCKPPQCDNYRLFITDTGQPVALLLTEDLSVLTHCLFGDLSECFNPISEIHLITLLNQLLGTESLQPQPVGKREGFIHETWFYKGAPTLRLTLSEAQYFLTVYLHPQWVLQALPKAKKIQKPKSDLQKALASQVLHCQIELAPLPLALNDVLQLQPGDVIKTDHPLSSLLLLNHQQQTICHVEIGANNYFKSIQIASSL